MRDRLNSIENAIDAIENGAQEYQIGTRRVKRADLKTLYEERRRLRAELNSSEGYSTKVAVFDTR
ncbi:hypothetical protein [Romboutsia sp. MSSM.1001216sp_RTP31141st1_G3_RTP31141_220114]|uniref:hypothetical protein n=1 Tax=unclassified Romboutsia TaxID=2626894 RepID=UPI0031B5BF96